MIYTISAKLDTKTAVDLFRKLSDGSISDQKPDGKEIVDSMNRARIDDSGTVRWSEACYCPTPLEHERQTVYDHHFVDFQTEQVEDHVEFAGEPLIEYLQRLHG